MTYEGRVLGQLLIEEGLMPPSARVLELVVSGTDAVVIRYEVYVELADLQKVRRAIAKLVRLKELP